MKCPNCGNDIPQKMKYCIYCGTTVNTGNPGQSPRRCKACGNVLQPGDTFCVQCGAQFTERDVTRPGQNNNNKTLVKVLLTMILAALFIAFIAFWFSRRGTAPSPSSTTPVTTPVADPQDLQGQDQETPSPDPQSVAPDQNTVEYSVVCIDSETGKTLQKNVYTGEIGEDITLDAPALPDLTPMQDALTITLTENVSENVMLFVYYEENIEDSYEDSYANVNIPDDNVLYYNGHTYFAVRTSSITSFWDANAYCLSRGGYLASINSDAENRALYDYVFYDRGFESAYFGFTDDGSEDEWYWSNGDPVTYTNWMAKQPDNLRGVENYALFYYEDTPYKWNDGDFGLDARGTVTFLIEWDTQ